MFVSFDLLTFLAWLFLSTFIPGVFLSLAVFKKDEEINLLEKLFVGFALGLFLLPMIPFLLYFLAGVQFSHTIALLSVGSLYVISLAAFFLTKAYEGIKIPKAVQPSKEHIISALLIIILIATYLVRIGTYSPVFQELDPYYYTYPAYQILTIGENPFDDQTSWYPEVTVNHRIVPALSYLESMWYSIYSGGEFNNLLLAVIASMYPPIAAVFAVFFMYLLVYLVTKKRGWGLLSAGIFAFAPMAIFKLAAGEQEVQPYAFFSMFFFYAMYALALKRKEILKFAEDKIIVGKDIVYPVLAGIAFASLVLGSATQVLAVMSIVIFLGLQSVLFFLRDEDADELRHFLVSNTIIFLIGPLLASSLILGIFSYDHFYAGHTITYGLGIAAVAALYFLKTRIHDRSTSITVVAGLAILATIMVFFTPLGDYIKGPASAGFAITQFNAPLDRTIAEQAVAGASFAGQMGFIAQSFAPPPALSSIGDLTNLVMFLVMLPFSVVGNIMLAVIVGTMNFALGTAAIFTEKDASFLLLWIVLFFAAAVYSLFKFFKKENDYLIALVLAITVPPLLVGIIKAKYTLYATAMLAIMVGYGFNQLGIWGRLFKGEKDQRLSYQFLLGIATIILLMQFLQHGLAASLMWASIQPLYQNNPESLAPKFQQMCDQSGDPEICAAASDPLGYASQGTNYQYSYKLCMLSVLSKYEHFVGSAPAPVMESQAAMFRCQRITPYWIDSMEWIKENTPEGSRTTSWWDYGHWINYFGQRNAVLRNEHASHTMIGAVADGYLDATPEELKAWMQAHDSEYALFDIELVAGGGSLGGKYGALNYLSCAHNNETSVAQSPGESQCENDHLWETVFVSGNPCTISTLTNKTGVIAYRLSKDNTYLPDYPNYCIQPQDPGTIAYCRDRIRPVPVYCIGEATLATGEPTYASYYLNQTYPNGDLKLNKGLMQLPYNYPTTYHFGSTTRIILMYTMDPIWLENGEIKSGYEDRKGKFYDSNIYKAIFLNNLPGFVQVYSTSGGEVKIYKIE